MIQALGSRAGLGAMVVVVMASVCSSSAPVHAADDGGIGAFFRDQFGIGADAPAVAPQYDIPDDHPVIVRRRPSRQAPRSPVVKIAVGPVAPVSIYDDRTLKVGDAVMTKKGLRVFVGGHSAPYTEADFASLSEAGGMPKQVEKALLVIDKAPRG